MSQDGASEIYLDCAATTWVLDEAADAMLYAMKTCYGNPSSIHRKGLEAERLIKEARESILSCLGVKDASSAVAQASGDLPHRSGGGAIGGPKKGYPRFEYPRLIFTSGGTEANNLAIMGGVRALLEKVPGRSGKSHKSGPVSLRLITSSIEHPSVLETFKQLEKTGFAVTYLPVNAQGIVRLEALKDALSPDEAVFVSVMHVNNETGSIQPIYEIASLIRRLTTRSLFHVDAVQSFGKLPEPIILDDPDLSPDFITLSSHKIHGPKGIGALYVAPNAPIGPIIYGGGQEYGIRSGTENVPAIAGFAVAAKASTRDLIKAYHHVGEVKAAFLKELEDERELTLKWTLNGEPPSSGRSSHYILNVGFPGLSGESIVHHLEARRVYVSTQSACSSRKPGPSHTLKAMGLDRETIEGSVRISFSRFTSVSDAVAAAKHLKEVVRELSELGGHPAYTVRSRR